jgi:hypothetical protein
MTAERMTGEKRQYNFVSWEAFIASCSLRDISEDLCRCQYHIEDNAYLIAILFFFRLNILPRQLSKLNSNQYRSSLAGKSGPGGI